MFRKSKYLLLLCCSSFLASCQDIVENHDLVETLPNQEIKHVELDTTGFLYSWQNGYDYKKALINQIQLPDGYKRIENDKLSFAAWLKHLPLKDNNTVYLYDRTEKGYQYAQYKVIDIDVGNKDLQQCADAVMRLRAEYLFATRQLNKIHFNYTNGVNIPFSKWSSGFYPTLKSNKVVWTSLAKNDESYESFKKYMTNIFMYAGTASLEKELSVKSIADIEAGDVFIKGGFPGHAVIVIDVAENQETGDRIFMLAQSYMPAQDIHILQNFHNESISPWYRVAECKELVLTPEWTFETNQLKSFVE